MRVRFTSAAEAELAEALEWYAAQAPRAAVDFLTELDRLTTRLAERPRQFPEVEVDVRRAGFRRFPYGLLFVLRGDEAWVFACFHASRDPRRWLERR